MDTYSDEHLKLKQSNKEKSMRQLQTYEQIKHEMEHNPLLVLYFTGEACGACEVIKSKVETMLEKYSHVEAIEINGEKQLELASKFEVYTLPLMLLFVEGKESMRVGRHIDLRDFENKIIRYSSLLGNEA